MTFSPFFGVEWLSGSYAVPGSGVNITRQREVSLAASTRSSSRGTSMSISSNSKLKAAFTLAGQARPAAALFSPSHPPQFLALGEGHLPLEVAAGYGAFDRHFSGHCPNVTTTRQAGGSDPRVGWSAPSTFAGTVMRPSHMIAVPVKQPRVRPPSRGGWKLRLQIHWQNPVLQVFQPGVWTDGAIRLRQGLG